VGAGGDIFYADYIGGTIRASRSGDGRVGRQGSNSTLTAPVRRRRAIVRMARFQSRNG
jgi:hypothetical protein